MTLAEGHPRNGSSRIDCKMAGQARRARVIPRRAIYSATTILAIYVLVFVRGLGWEWAGIFSAAEPAAAPRGAPNVPPPGPVSGAARPAAPGAASAGAPAAKVPLPPTDEPPPRDKTDSRGVFYDAQGVAVLGIDADPAGVYNVPPGRQLRIGGPQGQLFDVQPGGKITPATTVREQPK